ncbi:MAG: hypothetical protein IPO69_16085 [Saprospiraceae bacterium]|nr:hypothetical protein [Saprospiraceae bacterium]
MKINIPCAQCGCQNCDATTKSGEKVRIEICRCQDGSGEFDVSIIPKDGSQIQNEKHQCAEEEIEKCLTSRFNIDLDTMNHQCFN